MTVSPVGTIEDRTSPRHRPAIAAGIILGIAVLAFVLALSTAPSPAVDLFWQMRTGQWIAAHHAVPRVDLFSWSRSGHPWIVHEWGMCVLLWKCYRWDGFSGVYLLEAGLLTAVFLSLYICLLRETESAPITSACLAIWAAKLASPFISPRPHLFTYLFLIVFVETMLTVRRQPKKARLLFWLVPLSAIWANFHGGVIVGVGLLALFGICDLIESKGGALGKWELGVAATCALALSINPYGWRIYEIFTQTVGNATMPRFVSEWSALDFHSSLGYLFEALCALVGFGLVFTRERRSLAEVAGVLLLAHESLTASRNVPIFAFVALLATARHIQSALDRLFTRGHGGRSELFGDCPPTLIAAVVSIAIIFQSASFAKDQVAREHVDHGTVLQRLAATSFALPYFPRDAVRFLNTEGFPLDWRLYNDYNLGSYILWSIPGRKIFISTQTDVFFGDILDDYAKMDDLPFGWQSIVDRYQPSIVFLSADEPQSRLFAASPDWALCWADSANLDHGSSANVLIFVRNVRTNAALIDRCRRDCPTLRTHPRMTAWPLLAGGRS